jgi:hypothetical protein
MELLTPDSSLVVSYSTEVMIGRAAKLQRRPRLPRKVRRRK